MSTDVIELASAASVAFSTRTFEFRAEPSNDGLTLEGYAAVFNSPTRIADWEGDYEETIAPGAFKRSLGISLPKLQFDHGQHPLIGEMPIGVIRSAREDDHGLRIRARLHDNWLIEPVRDAIRDGSIDGMSFRFSVRNQEWSKDRSKRTLLEVSVAEVGPVVWPAYTATSVGVRARGALSSLTDPEVRREIARLLASGTDITSLATVDAPAEGHASDDPAGPARSHPEDTRTWDQVRALIPSHRLTGVRT